MHCRKKKQRGPAAASQQLGVLLYISSQKSVTLIEFTVKTAQYCSQPVRPGSPEWEGHQMFVQLSSHLHHHPHRTGRIKVNAGSLWCHYLHPSTPAGRAGAVGSEGLFVMMNLCWNMEFNSRSTWNVDIVLMVRVNNAGRLYFHYSFAAADFTFCVIMMLKNRPSLRGNEIHWENHIFLFLIINSLFFFLFFSRFSKSGLQIFNLDSSRCSRCSCWFMRVYYKW